MCPDWRDGTERWRRSSITDKWLHNKPPAVRRTHTSVIRVGRRIITKLQLQTSNSTGGNHNIISSQSGCLSSPLFLLLSFFCLGLLCAWKRKTNSFPYKWSESLQPRDPVELQIFHLCLEALHYYSLAIILSLLFCLFPHFLFFPSALTSPHSAIEAC